MSGRGANLPESSSSTSRETGTNNPIPAYRLYHKKSKKGCQRCRARRVKCDEETPICGGCRRHQATCTYDRTSPQPRDEALAKEEFVLQGVQGPSGQANDRSLSWLGEYLNAESGPEQLEASLLPESPERRKFELRLLHHWMDCTTLTMINPGNTARRKIWRSDMPRTALQHDPLLYSIFAFTALHLSKSDPSDARAVAAYRTYLVMALNKHHFEVAHLDKSNAGGACLTSVLIRLVVFGALQDRPIEPYVPPVQWLQVSSSAPRIFHAAWTWLREEEDSAALRLVERFPAAVTPEILYEEHYRSDLLHLLHRTPEQEGSEDWSEQIQRVYESALSVVGCALQAVAIDEAEQQDDGRRKLILFPYLVDNLFINLVETCQPRALVVLAHYFWLVNHFRDTWWVGSAGARELEGLKNMLSEDWRATLEASLLSLEAKLPHESDRSTT